MLHLFVTRQQLSQVERRANFANTLTGGAGTRDVIQEIVQQVVNRMRVVNLQAAIDDVLDLPVALSQQALQRNRCVEATVQQGFKDTANHPPQLVHVVPSRGILEYRGNLRERLEVRVCVAAFDPAEQSELEFRTQTRCDADRVLPGSLSLGGRLMRAARRQVEEEQRALRQQRLAARGAQIVENRQQDERDVSATGQQAVNVDWQLHHRAG